MNDACEQHAYSAATCTSAARSEMSGVDRTCDTLDRPVGVTHVALSLSRLGAGVSSVARQLGLAQLNVGLRVKWTCLDDKYLARDISGQESLPDDTVQAFTSFGPRQLAWSPSLRRGVSRTLDGSDLVHIHGLWSAPCHLAARAARTHGKPYVVSPHGMLDLWALRHRRWRKQLAGLLAERRFLARSSCIHALVESEFRDVRRYGTRRPVAIVPNGIDLTEFDREHSGDHILARWPRLANRRVALFLSRIHPKKGLPVLLEAWAEMVRRRSEWVLVIAGPGENGHDRDLMRCVEALGISQNVLLAGPVYGADKVHLLSRADFFVLPSYSEGFSMAVLEALASRLPVLITPNCNFPDVERFSAGHTVEPSTPGLCEGLEACMDMSSQELTEMGGRGRMLVERKYTWSRVVTQLNAVYCWLVAGGSPPDCVRTT